MVSLNRAMAFLVLATIVIYGIFKMWLLRLYASAIIYVAKIIHLEHSPFFETLKNQATRENVREQTLGWIIYYPTYLLLHIAFIFLLFKSNVKVRNYLTIGLISLIGFLVVGWLLFNYIGLTEVGSLFRHQFRNLFGLPFILLSIEGGRILYKDILTRLKETSVPK